MSISALESRGCEENPDYLDKDYDFVSYEVNPSVPHFVYIMSCCFMAIVCFFGVLANLSIFVLFCNSPLVSLKLLSLIFEINKAIVLNTMVRAVEAKND